MTLAEDLLLILGVLLIFIGIQFSPGNYCRHVDENLYESQEKDLLTSEISQI